MNKIIAGFIFFTLSSLIHVSAHSKALHCGPRGSFFSNMASHVAIPDYFPPENFLARLFVGAVYDFGMCEDNYEPVHLGRSCMGHDQCYTTLGTDKENCDQTLL